MNLWQWTRELWQTLVYDYSHIDWRSARARLAVKTAIAASVALYIAWSLNIDNPQWAAISAIIIVQASNGATIAKGIQRIIGTIIGVSWAVILVGLCREDVPLLIFMMFVTMTYSYYHGRFTPNFYAWTLGPATFLMVVLSASGSSGTDLTNLAYYRTIEIIIGTVSAILVNLVIYPSNAIDTLNANNSAMWNTLADLYRNCIHSYTSGKPELTFAQQVQALQLLIDQHAVNRQFSTQEAIFSASASEKIEAQEFVIEACSELLVELHNNCLSAHQEINAHFVAALQQVLAAAERAFTELGKAYLLDSKNQHIQQALQDWQVAVDALYAEYASLRATGLFLQYDPTLFKHWQQFILGLRNFVVILQNFRLGCSTSTPPKLTLSERLDKFFSFDRYYFIYALKAAAATVTLPLLGLYYNMSGYSMLAIILVILFQLDASLSLGNNQRLSFDNIMGFLLGSLAALLVLALNLTDVYAYLAAFAVVLFFTAYLQHSSGNLAYMGVWVSIMLAMGVATGMGPVTNWVSILELVIGSTLGSVLVIVTYTWVIPTNYYRLLQHYETQLTRCRDLIQKQLYSLFNGATPANNPQPRLLLQMELNEFKKHIKTFCSVDFSGHFDKSDMQTLMQTWQRLYHILFNIMLTQQTLNIPQELEQHFPGPALALSVLTPRQSETALNAAGDQISRWLTEYRARAREGHYLPVDPLVSNVSLFNLLQNYIEQNRLMTEAGAKLKTAYGAAE